MGELPAERAEVRRLLAWFDQKFAREVSDNLYREKIMKRFLRIGRAELLGDPRRPPEYPLPPRLRRLADRAAPLSRRRPVLARRHRRRLPSLGARLSRRRAVGAACRRQGLVCAHQVAPLLPPAAGRPHPRRAAAEALRRSRFLSAAPTPHGPRSRLHACGHNHEFGSFYRGPEPWLLPTTQCRPAGSRSWQRPSGCCAAISPFC